MELKQMMKCQHMDAKQIYIYIHRPDMGLMMDEVGCNLSQEMDHSVGGQKFLTSVQGQAYQSSSTKDLHFTCLGLTRLDGHPLMCIVIVAGKHHDIAVECGIDWNKLNEFDIDDLNNKQFEEFVQENLGEGGLFPGAPSSYYKGKEVPTFVTFSEKGGINGWILREILRRIDDLDLYGEDRKQGMYPFLLLDGHHSRFDLEFLKYIN